MNKNNLNQYIMNACFEYNVLTKDFFSKVFKDYCYFGPKWVEITDQDKNDIFNIEDFDYNDLENYEPQCTIKILDEQKNNYCKIVFPAHRNTHLSLYLTLNDESIKQVTHLAEKLTLEPQFLVAYIYDKDFVFWQSEEEISIYQVNSKPYKHLPRIMDEIFEVEKIDVSKNPGRRVLVSKMWLQISYVNIFGKNFYQYIQKNKILSFVDAHLIKELQNDGVLVKLYEKISESDQKLNLKKMQEFRELIELDSLIRRVK